ncbi:MAG: 30S ribosomal protein S6 [Pseudomonadota bacterium]
MPLYEHTFIARQDLSGQQAQTLGETFSQLVADNGGTVGKVEYWGLRNLTYRINKNRKGHYIFMNLEASSAAVDELERNLRLNEDVLRYLTVKVDAHEEGPSIVLQAKSSRDERQRRDRF